MANWLGSWFGTDKKSPSYEEVQRKTEATFDPVRRDLKDANKKLDEIERQKRQESAKIISQLLHNSLEKK